MHDVQSFYDVFYNTTGSFNWFYIDDRDIAFFHSGDYPQRANGIHPELPSWGNGQYDWDGFLPQQAHPQASNPERGYLASWNNRPARLVGRRRPCPLWFRPPQRHPRCAPATASGGRQRHPGTHGGSHGRCRHRGSARPGNHPHALALLEAPVTGDQDSAIRLMQDWVANGAMRRDRDGSGDYDEEAAVALMDAWYPLMIDILLQITDVEDVDGQNLSLMDRDNKPAAGGSAYNFGYYSYVERVLEQALGTSANPYRELRCANSDDSNACRDALADSLNQAIEQLGGIASMDSWDVDESQDQIQHRAIGLSGVAPIHWQNRPTFQQVVEFTGHR